MAVIITGDREVSDRFERFPAVARQKLLEAIKELTAQLAAQILAATPYKSGQLKSEIRERIYSDNSARVAGYVSVYAPGVEGEYAKAATLEYGTDKARRRLDRYHMILGLRFKRKKPVVTGMTRAVHIAARRYLRGPLEAMRPEIIARLDMALAQAVAESEGSA